MRIRSRTPEGRPDKSSFGGSAGKVHENFSAENGSFTALLREYSYFRACFTACARPSAGSDLDIVLAEQLVDLEQQLRGRLDADIVVPHPEAQGEVQGAGTEVGEQHHRRGVLEDVAVTVGHGGQQLHDQGGVAAVGHAHHHVTAHRTAVARPVDEARGHEFGVGHVDERALS